MCQQLLAALHIVSFRSIVENSRGGLVLLWNKQKSISQCFSVAANGSAQASKCFSVLFYIELTFILSGLRLVFKKQKAGFKFGLWHLYKLCNSGAAFQQDFEGLSIKIDVIGKIYLHPA